LTTKIEHYFDIIGIEDKIFIVPGSGVRFCSEFTCSGVTELRSCRTRSILSNEKFNCDRVNYFNYGWIFFENIHISNTLENFQKILFK